MEITVSKTHTMTLGIYKKDKSNHKHRFCSRTKYKLTLFSIIEKNL